MTTFIQVDLDTILNLVVCAEDYGYTTLYGDFALMTGMVSDKQINDYVDANFVVDEDYAEEDIQNVKDSLTEWRNKYLGYMNDDMIIEDNSHSSLTLSQDEEYYSEIDKGEE